MSIESTILVEITNAIKDIWNGSKIHPDINARYSRLKILDRIRQTQGDWKVAELSEKIMGKCLHKLFKAIVNELNNALPTLG